MNGLPVYTLPEISTFVIGKGVEEGFAEGGVWVQVSVPFDGRRGLRPSARTVVVVVSMSVAPGAV